MTGSSTNTVYVVTGGNRGLGLGLVKALLKRPNTTIVASIRNEQAAAALQSEVDNDETGDGSSLQVVYMDFSSAMAPKDIREAFDARIDHVDILISNAGYAHNMVPAIETTSEDLRAAFEINTIAPLMVFQGLWPLLQKSASPKAIMITSSVGSIAEMVPLPTGAYGPSRAAHNWVVKALHQENRDKGLIAIALHPGWVQTRMGEIAAEQWGINVTPPLTVEQSVKGMLEVIDKADKESSGKFLTQEGQIVGW